MPYANPPIDIGVKRWHGLHGDMQALKRERQEIGNISSEIPCRVSSDPHEWHNGVKTVLTMYSVKMQVS